MSPGRNPFLNPAMERKRRIIRIRIRMPWVKKDLNFRLLGYQPSALTTELHALEKSYTPLRRAFSKYNKRAF